MATSADIFSFNSPMVVAIDMLEKVSLLTSCDGDSITRLMCVFSIVKVTKAASERAFDYPTA